MLILVGLYFHQQSFALCVDILHGPTLSAQQSFERLQVLRNQVPPWEASLCSGLIKASRFQTMCWITGEFSLSAWLNQVGKGRIQDNFTRLTLESSFEMVFVKVSPLVVFFFFSFLFKSFHGLLLNKFFWREFSKAGEEKQFFRLVFRNVNSRGTTAALCSIASRSKS